MTNQDVCNRQCGNCPEDGDCPLQQEAQEQEIDYDSEEYDAWYHAKYQV